MKVADYIAQFFAGCSIKYIFGYQGGMITHLVDSITKRQDIQFIQTYHEQTASIAAQGYAIESKLFGVAISTSGPGATNMITGIADAYFDSIPVVYITGQVNTYEYKWDKPARQIGFQETDIVSIVKPITKYASFVDCKENIRQELEKAISIATANRKGPVLLDIPMNVQASDVDIKDLKPYLPCGPLDSKIMLDVDFKKAVSVLQKARKPLVLFGGGTKEQFCKKALVDFLECSGIPCVCSLLGKGVIDETCANFVGMVGSYGNRCANIALANCDVVLVLGSRLDLRQTGNRKSSLLKNICFIIVDIDKNELLSNDLPNTIKINADICDFLKQLKNYKFNTNNNSHNLNNTNGFNDTNNSNDFNNHNVFSGFSAFSEWKNKIKTYKNQFSQEKDIKRCKNKLPYNAIKFIAKKALDDAVFCVDVGQNQMWAAQYIFTKKGQDFYTSGGLAPMGYALNCAIGVAFACPKRQVIVITGDGGFSIALQALLLISQYHLNISVCILNNQALGMITQFQSLYFNNNMAGTTKKGGYITPNIKFTAKGFRLKYKHIAKNHNLIKLKPNTIYDIDIGDDTIVAPKLEYNQPLDNMLPYLK